MQYTTLATEESIKKAGKTLLEHGYESIVLENGREALEKIKSLIPEGASVMNGSSRTLEQIGFVEYLKSGKHPWNNLHEAIVLEKDPESQKKLRKDSVNSDFYLGSAHAISETGEMIFASNSGSQLPHLAFTSQNIILVVSTKKITPTLLDGLNRIDKHIVPLENENMMQKYGVGTIHSKTLILHRENPRSGRKILVILVKEDLGF